MASLGAAADTMLEIIKKIAANGQTMERDVRSRAIEHIGYNPMMDIMSIRFKGKNAYPTYEYPDVPTELVARFTAARSKGKFYHRHIKNQYGEGGYP